MTLLWSAMPCNITAEATAETLPQPQLVLCILLLIRVKSCENCQPSIRLLSVIEDSGFHWYFSWLLHPPVYLKVNETDAIRLLVEKRPVIWCRYLCHPTSCSCNTSQNSSIWPILDFLVNIKTDVQAVSTSARKWLGYFLAVRLAKLCYAYQHVEFYFCRLQHLTAMHQCNTDDRHNRQQCSGT